jgi:hypothetical protein
VSRTENFGTLHVANFAVITLDRIVSGRTRFAIPTLRESGLESNVQSVFFVTGGPTKWVDTATTHSTRLPTEDTYAGYPRPVLAARTISRNRRKVSALPSPVGTT